VSHYTADEAQAAFFVAMREAEKFAVDAGRAEGDARAGLYRRAADAYRTALGHVPFAKVYTRSVVAESIAACLDKAGDADAARAFAAEMLARPNLTPNARASLVHHLTPYLDPTPEPPCEPSP